MLKKPEDVSQNVLFSVTHNMHKLTSNSTKCFLKERFEPLSGPLPCILIECSYKILIILETLYLLIWFLCITKLLSLMVINT